MGSSAIIRCALVSLVGLLGHGPLRAQDKIGDVESWAAEAPEGTIEALHRVTGARASSTLATVIHCSNNDAVPVSVYVTYYEFNNQSPCALDFQAMPAGTTRSFTTADTTTFSEDRFCATPAPTLGQVRVEIGTFPLHAKVVCSAQVVSVNGNPPATLSSLDVFPAN